MTDVISTPSGDIRGTRTEGVHRFLGIPFATAARFAPPVAAAPWPGTLVADRYGPLSPQVPGELYLHPDVGESEDCLSLNVWTPDPSPGPGGHRPVMVWIHGGGFRQGGAAHLLYDAAPLCARGDVVVVTLNYRLGALGFLAHPDLGANRGLLDQIAALRWVRDHVAAFGGDPGNVTIFGESAGSTSVALLTVAPAARGLFHKAIAQSGAGSAAPLAVSVRRAEDLAVEAGVADVAALRDLPVEAVVAAQAALEQRSRLPFLFVPTVDGVLFDDAPRAARRAGAAADTPMIFGTNVDEWRLWAPADPRSRDLDDAGLHRRVERILRDGADDVIDTFRRERAARGESTAANDLWFAIETDRFFRAPVLADADAHVAHQPATFVYRFAWPSPAMGGWLGACHALEIAFVFGVQGREGLTAFTGSGPDADLVGHRMLDAWAAFAHTGDPSTGDPSTGGLEWPGHDPETRPTLVFDVTSRVVLAPAEAERVVVTAHGVDPLS